MQIKFGGLISDGRGSVGGLTFARNASGAYVRQRTMPINPNSPRQAQVRANQSLISALWLDSATASQRIEWETFAKNVSSKNKLGEDINPSGFNRFVQSNMVAENAGLPRFIDGPSLFSLPAQDNTVEVAVSEGSQELSVTFDEGRDWIDLDGAGMLVYMGIPVNPTINFFAGPYRFAGIIKGDSITAPTSPATIAVPFPVVEGQKIFSKTKIIFDDGRVSATFQVDSICGA